MNRRRVGLTAAGLIALLVVLELAAVPVATAVIGRVVARCVDYASFEVAAVDRPVVPRLLLGRARGVELRATDLAAGPFRVAEAQLHLPEAVLPWAVGGDDEVATATLTVRAEEAAVEDALAEVVPFGVPIEVELHDGFATLGSPVLPFDLDVEARVDDDGTVRLRPVRGGELLERIGIAASYDASATARMTALDVGEGELRAAAAFEVVPGVGGGGACEEPLLGDERT